MGIYPKFLLALLDSPFFPRFFVRSSFIFLLFLSLSISQSVLGAGNNFYSLLGAGYHTQGYAGLPGANFSTLTHYDIDFSFSWGRGWWSIGFGTTQIPGLKFKDVVIKDGTTGNYNLSFTQNYLLLGAHKNKWFTHFIIGTEVPAWVGTPEMGASIVTNSANGLQVGYRITPTSGKKYTFPVYFRYLSKPERSLNFANFPLDNMNVRSGSEIDANIGVELVF